MIQNMDFILWLSTSVVLIKLVNSGRTFFDGNVKEIYERFGNTVTVKRNGMFHNWTWCDKFGIYLYNHNFNADDLINC